MRKSIFLLYCIYQCYSRALPTGKLLDNGISARLGVRYADPPTRFQPAKLANNWADSKMDQPAKACPQIKVTFGTSEDCLFLNVFGPAVPDWDNLPVIVYIHGGAYRLGSGNEFTVEALGNLSKNSQVIVVTIQYRLSVLGFFYPNLQNNSGLFTPNLGLSDTHLALQFIHENIWHFGGDPKQVTLIGHSAGACSAHALALSTAVDPVLFKRVILMSGVLEICFDGVGSPENPSASAALEICNYKLYDRYDNMEQDLYRCLVNASLDALESFEMKHGRNWVLYADDNYFPKSGHQTMSRSSRGHEFLIGVTSGEWAFFENLFAKWMGKTTYDLERFHSTIVTYAGITDRATLDFLEFYYRRSATREIESLERLQQLEWFGRLALDDWQSPKLWFEAVVNVMTDLVFHLPIASEVEKLRNAKVPPSLFVYTYNVTSADSWNEKKHAAHGDELPWLFGPKFGGFGNLMLFFAKNGHLGDWKTTGLMERHRAGNNKSNNIIFENGPWYMEDPQGFDGFCPRARTFIKAIKGLGGWKVREQLTRNRVDWHKWENKLPF